MDLGKGHAGRRTDAVLLLLPVSSLLDAADLAQRPVAWAGAVATAAAAAATARAAPPVSLGLAASLGLFTVWAHSGLWTVAASAVLCFLAGHRATRLRDVQVAFAAVASVALAVGALLGGGDWVSLLMVAFAAAVLPWWAGDWWRQRTALVHAGWELADRLEREQRFVAERARLKERAQIADDMHDSLGHELSVMALLAGGLEVDPDLPERHRAAVRSLRERSVLATERLHQVVGLLREAAAPPLEPAGETLDDLVRRFADTVPLRFEEHGDRGLLTPPAERAAYRVVLEALTNAVKHAPGAPVTVDVRHGAAESLVAVVNEPPPEPSPEAASTAPPRAVGSGSGLIAMDERVRVLGGSLRTRPCRGGFEVRARLPHDPSAASPADAGAPGAPGAHPPAQTAADSELRRARTGLRRRTARAALVPVLLGTALVVVLMGLHVLTSVTTSLAPEDYARLRVGQPRAELAASLPARTIGEPPPLVRESPVPAGADCAYYRAGGGVLGSSGTVYRLCFDGDVLVAKDAFDDGAAR
ncbi:histidine kinase [Streptomyces sp. DSM 42041]|uniref:histidine kinase n=1 Tax=Streptomyces hazeniae TaxID=3075538 RepID=A0ABU2NLY0_9ACTN|nr:histidine kinase [Streptomyces sp. DSM 42041]MDT0377734.1 histidine kinase [Streptomyces sp. DSM 42041]